MPTIDDFVLLKPISKGAYGSVYLAKKRTTGEYYAIKALRKADMIAKNQISNVKAERAIMMAQTGSPFVVRLLYTFQSRTNLYLVMEYLNGGDCASLLKAIGTLPEDWARQYLAEVVLDSVFLGGGLINRRWAVRYKLMKRQPARRAPKKQQKHYIAPESILGLEAGKSVDWWALGVICYEFIFGIPPFHDDTPEKVFKNILSSDIDFYDDLRGKPELKDDVRNGCGSCFGEDEYDDGEPDVPLISPEARDFITKLLCRDPKRRLGYNGTDEVKAHPMFRGIDWDTILETQASFVPNVENIEDTDYFDPRGATMNDQESMEHLEGKPDGSGAGGALMRDTWQSAVPKPEWKIDAGSSISKSHETQFDISKYVIRAPLNRAKTLPAILGNDGIYSETNSGTVSGSQVLSPEPPSSKGGVRDLDASDGQKYRQSLSSVDAAPGSEFGVFTFKNLHVLEQANMNELVKLRRRSTMLDVSTAPASRPTTRASYSFGPSSPTSPSPLTLNMQQCPHTGTPFGGG
ncbi:rim15, signal transduction response regulator, partial [Coemansia sp. RSA 2559]